MASKKGPSRRDCSRAKPSLITFAVQAVKSLYRVSCKCAIIPAKMASLWSEKNCECLGEDKDQYFERLTFPSWLFSLPGFVLLSNSLFHILLSISKTASSPFGAASNIDAASIIPTSSSVKDMTTVSSFTSLTATIPVPPSSGARIASSIAGLT